VNPFDLAGPQFLAFYAALIVAVAVALVLVRRAHEGGEVPKLLSVDPYLVAQLRGGPGEAVRVATLALVDRGLLKAEGAALTTQGDAADRVRRPLERAILQAVGAGRAGHELPVDGGVLQATATLDEELRRLGLLPSSVDLARRWTFGLAATGSLWAVSAIKIVIAFGRGRHNVGFLVLLTCVATVTMLVVSLRTRTVRGDRLLVDLRTLFSGLRERAASLRGGGGSAELSLLAGVFGLSALSGSAFVVAEGLFPKATRAGATASSSCGSTCSSTSSGCGSSCGSSCGGGCGGGCGGCGS